MKGVDISHYQKGLSIKQIKDAGSEFAIIKLTEGNFLIDSAAFAFYHEAFTLGFPVGCYCYSHATTAEQARREAEFLLKTINGFPMPCGIFLDVEEPKQLGLSHDALLAVLVAWCAGIAQHGYIPGVYGSEGNLWSKISPDELPEGCLVWVAKWSLTPPDQPCDLWQDSDSGRVNGFNGNVDTDLSQSVRFETLVDAGGCDYQYHRELTPSAPDKPPDTEAADRQDPVGIVNDLLLSYLQTTEFRESFSEYVKNSCALIERR